MVREIAQGANSIGTRTNTVTAVEVTDCDTHDIHMFRPLLEKSVRRFTVKRVTADKAYSSARIFGLADQHGAEAYVPLKKNATGLRPDKWTAPRVRNLGARA